MTVVVPARFVLPALALCAVLVAGGSRAQTTQLSGLHDALHLTNEQESAWRRYVAAVRPDPQAEARHRSAQQMMASLPTPRRVDLINAEVDEDAAAVHGQGQAVKAFYATLTPDQQRSFDRQTAQGAAQSGSDQGQDGAPPLRQPPNSQLPAPRQP